MGDTVYDIKNTEGKNTLNIGKELQRQEFINKLIHIYENVELRFDYKNWEEVFKEYLNEETSQNLEKTLLNFLFTHHYVPYEVWDFVENKYRWSEKINDLKEDFPEKKNRRIFKILQGEIFSIANYIPNLSSSEIDRYFDIINECNDEFANKGNLEKIKLLINKAHNITLNDSSIVLTEGVYKKIAYNDIDEALECFKKAYEINSEEFSALFNIGIMLQKKGMYEESIYYLEKELSKLSESNLNNTIFIKYIKRLKAHAMYELGKSYYYSGDLYRAKDIFDQLKSLNEYNEFLKESNKFYLNIEKRLKGEKVKILKPKKEKKKRKKPYKVCPYIKKQEIIAGIAICSMIIIAMLIIKLAVITVVFIIKKFL